MKHTCGLVLGVAVVCIAGAACASAAADRNLRTLLRTLLRSGARLACARDHLLITLAISAKVKDRGAVPADTIFSK